MKPQRTRSLIALNAALLAALALVTFPPGVSAQRESKRVRGDYTMVTGRVLGMTEAAIYIIDSGNSELVAVRWDQSRKALAPLGFRDMASDARGTGGAR